METLFDNIPANYFLYQPPPPPPPVTVPPRRGVVRRADVADVVQCAVQCSGQETSRGQEDTISHLTTINKRGKLSLLIITFFSFLTVREERKTTNNDNKPLTSQYKIN